MDRTLPLVVEMSVSHALRFDKIFRRMLIDFRALVIDYYSRAWRLAAMASSVAAV